MHTIADAASGMNLLVEWSLVGGFLIGLLGSVFTAAGYLSGLRITQREHARRLDTMEQNARIANDRMLRMDQGITKLLERTKHLG